MHEILIEELNKQIYSDKFRKQHQSTGTFINQLIACILNF